MAKSCRWTLNMNLTGQDVSPPTSMPYTFWLISINIETHDNLFFSVSIHYPVILWIWKKPYFRYIRTNNNLLMKTPFKGRDGNAAI